MLVEVYRRFETAYWSHLQGSSIPKLLKLLERRPCLYAFLLAHQALTSCVNVIENKNVSQKRYRRERNSCFNINKIQRDATVCRCLFTAKLLYMFRVSIAPIMRNTSNCNCSFWYRSNHVSEQQPSASVA